MDGTHVKIGPLTYRIERVEGLTSDDDGRELWGQARFGKALIEVEQDLSATFARVVLWHEIVHIILEQGGHTQDESLCDLIGYALTQILDDNPWLSIKA